MKAKNVALGLTESMPLAERMQLPAAMTVADSRDQIRKERP